MADIDNLEIKITSTVAPATRSIGTLVNKLNTLNKTLNTLNTTGLNNLSSSLNRLTQATASFSNVDTKKIGQVANSLNRMSRVPVGNLTTLGDSTRRLASSLSYLNVVDFSGVSQLGTVATEIRRFGTQRVSNAVSNMPWIVDSLKDLSNTMRTFSMDGLSALSQLATTLPKLGGKMVSNATTVIPKLTQELGLLFQSLSRAPTISNNTVRVVEALAQLSSRANSLSGTNGRLTNWFKNIDNGAKKASKSHKSLATAIGKIYASYWMLFRLFNKLGKAIDYASSLTEVKNVLQVTFGDSVDLIENFADSAITNFGISELAAKQMAGRFQAMGVAMGYSKKEMSEYSIALTGLAGDMASFYDVAVEDVAEDLESIFTGQTKPLRAYGMDLTEATLKEFALRNGLNADIESMSQAEKMMLRYQYVMKQTSGVQGDFIKTQDSWHNQMTIFKQNLVNIGAQIGQMFIYTFKPALMALNQALALTAVYAERTLNALGKIFGWKIENYNKGTTQDTEDYFDDITDSVDGASSAVDKFKKQLQGFDELNNLTSNNANDSGNAIANSFQEVADAIDENAEDDDKWMSDINSLYALGKRISDTIYKSLADIDWDEVYSAAASFGTGLADFLNGLFQPDTFSIVASTIAKKLNTAIIVALSFGEEFDFDNFGQCIADGINSFFNDFDFKQFARAFNTWSNGLFTAMAVAITEIKWSDVFDGMLDFLKELDWEGALMLSVIAFRKSGGPSRVLSSVFSSTDGQVPDGVKKSNESTASMIFNNFTLCLATAFAGFKFGTWLYENVDWVTDTADSIVEKTKLGDLAVMLADAWEDGSLVKKAEETGKKIAKSVFGLFTDTSYTDPLLASAWENYKAANNLDEVIKDDLDETQVKLAWWGSIDQETLIYWAGHSMGNALGSGIIDGVNGSLPTDSIVSMTQNVGNTIVAGIQFAQNSSPEWYKMRESLASNVNWSAGLIKGTEFGKKGVSLVQALNSGQNSSSEWYTTRNKINDNVNWLADGISPSLSKWNASGTKLVTALNNGQNSSQEWYTMRDKVGENIDWVVKGVGTTTASWISSGANLVKGLATGVEKEWKSADSDSLSSIVKDMASGLTAGLNLVLGIHSPSRVWAESGKYLPLGLKVGIESTSKQAEQSVIDFANEINSSFDDTLKPIDPMEVVAKNSAKPIIANSTTVTSQISQSVETNIEASQVEQNKLLRQQNELLSQILAKETGIKSSDVFNAVRNESKSYFNQTGDNALVY